MLRFSLYSSMKAKQKESYIAYYRVSTRRQGASGLGLEAQRATVEAFLGCSDCIIGEFIEAESGKRNARPQLQAAIQAAKDKGAKLVIAKLDRLSRNAAFIHALRDSGVDFVACDLPDANTLTIGIFAALAQHERELISQRTKAALQAKKEREPDWKPGTPNPKAGGKVGGVASGLSRKADARAFYSEIIHLVESYREAGHSLRECARRLNERGYKTRRDKEWTAQQVSRAIKSIKSPITI